MQAIIVLFAVTLLASTLHAQDFTYDGQRGPAHWGEAYKSCSGKHQSPINIDALHVIESEYPALELKNFNVAPKSATVLNKHTVLVHMFYDNDTVPVVKGGPLGTDIEGYQFEQFHFHWGSNDSVGSENLINNASFPAELHVVLRNRKYQDFASALGQVDGVAVMAFFFEIQDEDNKDYWEFTDLLEHIPRNGMSAEFKHPLPLKNFLTYNFFEYYTYIGSLTTPPCSENVIWMDFSVPISISENQINRFRALYSSDEHPLSNNFRPTQPLNDRTVFMAVMAVDEELLSEEHSIPFVDAANGAADGKSIESLLMLLSATAFCCALKLLLLPFEKN